MAVQCVCSLSRPFLRKEYQIWICISTLGCVTNGKLTVFDIQVFGLLNVVTIQAGGKLGLDLAFAFA